MKKESSMIPVLNIREFRNGQDAGRDELLFNYLHGEKHIEKPHKHDFFVIILFEKAKGIHTIDSVDYHIGNRQIHILFPGQVHNWHIKPKSSGYQLMMESSFLEQFAPYFRFSFTNYQNHPVITLPADSFHLLLHEFTAIREELKSSNPLRQLITARSAVIAAIVSKEAEKTFTEFKVYQSNPRLTKFNMLIDEHFKEQKFVAFYAEQLHISANYLNILCRRNLKISATELIQQRVCLEAKRLLQTTGFTIKETAFELGFRDHAYFSNFFKNQTGLSPSDFREQL
ncbi:AraC family transcriptional regulator [Pinibacter aurantiacus]|uniref:AraC family transcriptional regulator n=1 Tax=Pinibacter aurantiacus TaxID=2851599 RepID=A0A9E2SFS8_9BACT|nr:helix-turn-helix domain-containing protein [Pinibacter aurantiacus]MBV4360410.1 AraC family transcriptional regulator [Pinibacter aurantiacus]